MTFFENAPNATYSAKRWHQNRTIDLFYKIEKEKKNQAKMIMEYLYASIKVILS